MKKKTWHSQLHVLRSMSSWYLIVGLVISSVMSVTSLRQNNITALRLRDAVLKADEQNGDVEKALRELRSYVHGHMNTNLATGPNAIKPPIQLKFRYERLVAAEKARVSTANAKIYTEAQATCERLNPEGLSGRGRVPCIEDYVAKNGVKEQPIPDALYKFDFASPVWSPDFAGWSLVAVAVFGLLLGLRLGLLLWLRRYMRELS